MATNIAPGDLPTPSCRSSPSRDGHQISASSPAPSMDKPGTNVTQETTLVAIPVDSSAVAPDQTAPVPSIAQARAVAQFNSLQDALSKSMEYNNLPENIYHGLPTIVPLKKRGAKRSRSTAPAGSGPATKRSRRDEVDQEPGSWVLDKVPNKLPLVVSDEDDREPVANEDDEADKDTETADIIRLFVVGQAGHVLPTWAQSLPQPSSSSALYFEAMTATRNVNTRFVRQSMLPKDRQVGEDVTMEDEANKKVEGGSGTVSLQNLAPVTPSPRQGWLFSILDRQKNLKRTPLNDLPSSGSSTPDPSLFILPRVRVGCFLPRETNEAMLDLNEQSIPNGGSVSNGPNYGNISMDVDGRADDSDVYSQAGIAVLDDDMDAEEEASGELGVNQLIDGHNQERPVLASGSTSFTGAASDSLKSKRISRKIDSTPATPHRSSARVAAKSPVKSTPSQVKSSVKAKPTASKSKPVVKPPTEAEPSASSSAKVKGTKDDRKQGRPPKANGTPRNAKGKGKAKERVAEQVEANETDVYPEATLVPLKLDLKSDSNAVTVSGSTSESNATNTPESTSVFGHPEPKTNASASDVTETRNSRGSTQGVLPSNTATSSAHNPYMAYIDNPSALSYMSKFLPFTSPSVHPNTFIPHPIVNSSTLNPFFPPPPMVSPAPSTLVPHSLYAAPVIRAEDVLQSLPIISALPVPLQTYLFSALAGGVPGKLPPAFGGAPGIGNMTQFIGSNGTGNGDFGTPGPLLSSNSTASASTPSSALPTQVHPFSVLSSTATGSPVHPQNVSASSSPVPYASASTEQVPSSSPGRNTRSSRASSSVQPPPSTESMPTRQSKNPPKSPDTSSMEIKPPRRRKITHKKPTKGGGSDLAGDTKRSFIRSSNPSLSTPIPAETVPVASGSGSAQPVNAVADADGDTDAEGEVDLNFFAPYVVNATDSNHFVLS